MCIQGLAVGSQPLPLPVASQGTQAPTDHEQSSLMTWTMDAPQKCLVQSPHFTAGGTRGRRKGSNLSKVTHGAVANPPLELTHSFCPSFLLVPGSVQGAGEAEVTRTNMALPQGAPVL